MEPTEISSGRLIVVKDYILLSNDLIDDLLDNDLNRRIERPVVPPFSSFRENL
jgi:hypothetical protein